MLYDHYHFAWKHALAQTLAWREEKRSIVFTNGCFDLLHPGHMDYLKSAHALGDVLIIGLNTDESIRALKGEKRPVNALEDRDAMLSALRWVDAVIPFSQETPLELIRYLRPDVLAKGGDYTIESMVGSSDVLGWGGDACTIPFKEGYSSSQLIQRICGLYAA
ncbi:MAG: D-glycero-beta-D-manno-heptose 1-phosphate adenylyltransferase [Mariprofundaceae bacterium]|nr:D-glycero-beta-D-manno-heptose 1-phosphate adenylyltransferase [Mariprofundaceae bacterium]